MDILDTKQQAINRKQAIRDLPLVQAYPDESERLASVMIVMAMLDGPCRVEIMTDQLAYVGFNHYPKMIDSAKGVEVGAAVDNWFFEINGEINQFPVAAGEFPSDLYEYLVASHRSANK